MFNSGSNQFSYSPSSTETTALSSTQALHSKNDASTANIVPSTTLLTLALLLLLLPPVAVAASCLRLLRAPFLRGW
jgi:hypothetical protein